MSRCLVVVTAVVIAFSALAVADLVDDSILTGQLGSTLGGLSGFDDDHDDHIIYPVEVPRRRGSVHVSSVPDLVNLVLGLGGHIVGRAGWIVHDAVRSLAEGVMTSRYKLMDDDNGFYARYRSGFSNPKLYGGADILDLDDLRFQKDTGRNESFLEYQNGYDNLTKSSQDQSTCTVSQFCTANSQSENKLAKCNNAEKEAVQVYLQS